MTSSRIDETACESLAGCVAEIEKYTDAELVIVVRARSGSYSHADYLAGALLAFAGLLFLLFSPINFHQYWVAIDVALLFVLGAFVSARTHAIRRVLTTRKFRERAVRTGAAAMFYEAGIANTQAELGVLVYVSLLERRLEVIADRGVLQAVPALEWNESLFELHQAGRASEFNSLLKSLRLLGALLAAYLPMTGDNPNELPDKPRVEL
jgi:putative membrane protein